ncbi:DUF1684 domain-containing protein [Rhodoflexus sp.]
MKTSVVIVWCAALCCAVGCTADKQANESTTQDYAEEIRQWHEERKAALMKDDGWLNLVGLFWLREGENSFGSDSRNDIVFPADKATAKLGTLILSNGSVRFVAAPRAEVTADSIPVKDTLIFVDQQQPVVLAHKSLRWFIIRRGNRYGVRLRDLEHLALKRFTGIPMYDIDRRWRIRARLEPATADKLISITDILGQVSQQPSPGTLVFDWQGTSYRLDAVESGEKLFIPFADETNKQHTYAAGRFLYADKPDSTGYTILDFNKAINPPCAFTEFATCPLPPPQNRLPLAVKAGEKRYSKY